MAWLFLTQPQNETTPETGEESGGGGGRVGGKKKEREKERKRTTRTHNAIIPKIYFKSTERLLTSGGHLHIAATRTVNLQVQASVEAGGGEDRGVRGRYSPSSPCLSVCGSVFPAFSLLSFFDFRLCKSGNSFHRWILTRLRAFVAVGRKRRRRRRVGEPGSREVGRKRYRR